MLFSQKSGFDPGRQNGSVNAAKLFTPNNAKSSFFGTIGGRVYEIKIARHLKLKEDGRLFVSSEFWAQIGLGISLEFRPEPGSSPSRTRPDLQLYNINLKAYHAQDESQGKLFSIGPAVTHCNVKIPWPSQASSLDVSFEQDT